MTWGVFPGPARRHQRHRLRIWGTIDLWRALDALVLNLPAPVLSRKRD